MAGKKVIIGMSGGVDSAVSALQLVEQGYDVSAIFMQNWDHKNDPNCSAAQDLTDARAVCDKLKIPLTTVNFTEQYWHKVFQYMLDEYSAGRTPNPDIICNQEIKFKAFLQHALASGAHYIATGHYAQIREENGKWHLLKAVDLAKDQTYFLYTLGQEALSKTLFPIGHLKKNEVRLLAQKAGLSNYHKKDSTGICFIGERNFRKFLGEYLLSKPGEIVTTKNVVLGKHQGVMFYTLGQRQGLGIGGQKQQQEAPWYVVAKNLEKNQLIVAQKHDHPLLLSQHCISEKNHWIQENAPTLPLMCWAKTRYRQTEQKCTITNFSHDHFYTSFQTNQWAVTPGQAIVYYAGDECLGGGTIVSANANH